MMSGVNDLAKQWQADDGTHIKGDNVEWDLMDVQNAYEDARMDCVNDLREVSETAWHPVSEPPTEEDGDDAGSVLFKRRYDIPMQMENVATVAHASESLRLEQEGRIPKQMGLPRKGQWARIRDVVLLPPNQDT